MCDIDTTLDEMVSDKKGPVAVQGVLFGAHQRNAVIRHSSLDSLQATTKARCSCKLVVTDAALFVTGWIVGSSAQLAAEKHVSYSGGLQRLREGFAIVLGVESAVGRRTHIGNDSHVVPGQEFEKDLQRMIGMTDRQYHP